MVHNPQAQQPLTFREADPTDPVTTSGSSGSSGSPTYCPPAMTTPAQAPPPSLLEYAVGPRAYALMQGQGIAPEGATDSDLGQYADLWLQYDDLNQVLNVYGPFSQLATQYQEHGGDVTSGSYKVQYLYDPANPTRLQNLVYPNGRTEWFSYSGLDASIGRVSSVSDGTSSAASAQPLEQYSYLGLGQMVGRTLPAPGISQAVTLDAYGRVAGIDSTKGTTHLDQYAYGYDKDGNVSWRDNVAATAAGHPEFGENYFYDKLNHYSGFNRGVLNPADVVAAPLSPLSIAWPLDSQGNRADGSYSLDNRISGTYDQAGAPQTLALSSTNASVGIKYDAWGRVVRTASDRLTTYSYDALGRRITSKSFQLSQDPATATPFAGTQSFYDGQNLLEERDLSGTVQTQYVWSAAGPSQILLRDQNGQRLYALHDAMGSTTALTDAAGNIVERYAYESNGRPVAYAANWGGYTWGSNSLDAKSSRQGWEFLWHGQRWHGLYQEDVNGSNGGGLYESASGQWYDPHHGRLIQPDFKAFAAAKNQYDPHKEAYTVPLWEYALPYSELTTTSWFMNAADAGRPYLKGAAFVGSFIPPIAGPSIAASIFLSGADTYAGGASWGQLGRQVGIEAGITLATFGLAKGVGMLAARGSVALAESRAAASAANAFQVEYSLGARSAASFSSGGWEPHEIATLIDGVTDESSLIARAIRRGDYVPIVLEPKAFEALARGAGEWVPGLQGFRRGMAGFITADADNVLMTAVHEGWHVVDPLTAKALFEFELVTDEVKAVRELRAAQITDEYAIEAGFTRRYGDMQDLYKTVLTKYNVPQPPGFEAYIARFWPIRR